MTPLERKVVEAFRAHGDAWFSALPDWPNTEVSIGEETKIGGHWIKHDGTNAEPGWRVRPPRRYHHRLTISPDLMIAAHTLLGLETLGDAVVTQAHVIGERAADGPVWRIEAIRKYYDQIGWSFSVAMRAHDGNLLRNRCRHRDEDLAEVRKARRDYLALIPDGIDWDGPRAVRDPNPTDHSMEGTTFSHVIRIYSRSMLLAFVRPPVEVAVCAMPLADGRWMLADRDRMWIAVRDFEAGQRSAADEAPMMEKDPEAELLLL